MLPRLPVSLNEEGLPCAHVAGRFMWDLVEYLACQRAAVTYQYEASHFSVIFTHVDLPTAQCVLDGWTNQMTPGRLVPDRLVA
jgi:hypothetical protein